MKRDFEARLKLLEERLKNRDGVILVEQVPGGYLLPNGDAVKDLKALQGQYSVIIIDDL